MIYHLSKDVPLRRAHTTRLSTDSTLSTEAPPPQVTSPPPLQHSLSDSADGSHSAEQKVSNYLTLF